MPSTRPRARPSHSSFSSHWLAPCSGSSASGGCRPPPKRGPRPVARRAWPSRSWGSASSEVERETGQRLAGLSVIVGLVRADRLVAILLMLQQRGQVTAAEVADELEISERTARRDLEALGVAGIPIYSQQGRNGGWRLAGGGRTDLSGLTASEARALFLAAGPSPMATPQVKAALRKLVRALPEPLRSGAEAAATAVVVDPTGWDGMSRPRPTPPFLDAVQKAVVD